MKILSADQIRELDQYTIEHEPITSVELMERACLAFCKEFERLYTDKNSGIKIFCGPGNNGGDGLGIARILIGKGWGVDVFILEATKYSAEFEDNLGQLRKIANENIHEINSKADFPAISANDIIIDALFGSGLSRPLSGVAAEVVKYLNSAKATVIAVDIPSGLYADKANADEDVIIKAGHTFTFQFPKLSLLLCTNYEFSGDISILDIGLSAEYIERVETPFIYTEGKDIKQILKPREKYSHKGSYGHALIFAGSYGKMGAAVLCAKACLRTGAGLTTAYIPGCGYDIMQVAAPEVMAIVDENKKFLTNVPDTFSFSAIGIGPGIGKAPHTRSALARLIKHYRRPVVLDADALNILAEDAELMERIPPNSILTPHPKEFSRLAGSYKNDWELFEKATDFAAKHNCLLVLKSARTSIHTPEGKVYFNSSGNPGMAKGGSGDALTGMITALLCQEYSPLEAAIMGVYLHGLAGDIAAETFSQWSMTASDLVESIGHAFKVIAS
jgi:hydroxyethylthiazole kinase-like uncharacterized protein yjeF